jgi:ankyrin repeat protein
MSSFKQFVKHVRNNNVSEVEKVLQANPEWLNKKDPNWCDCTPLIHAANKGADEVVKLLMGKGAEVDELELFLVHVKRNNVSEVEKALLANPEWLNKKDPNCHDFTPLMYAVTKGAEEVVKLLMGKGAEVEAEDRQGRTAVHFAAERGSREMVRELLEGGGWRVMEKKSRSGMTALMVAAVMDKKGKVEELCRWGADKELKDDGGKTARDKTRSQ